MRVEKLIKRLRQIQEDVDDISLEIVIDIFDNMRRNISSRGIIQGYLADDKWKDLKWGKND